MALIWIYALMVIIPSLLLILMVVLGMEHDVEADVDADADLDLGGDVDVDVEADLGDIGDVGGPGVLGVKLILSFIIGFGLAGFLAVQFEWPIPHVISGLIGGALVYTIVYQLLKVLYKQQANSIVRSSSVVGRKGLVTSPIMKGGTGEIKTEDPRTGRSLYLRARPIDSEREYKSGDEVTIKSVIAGLAKVE